MSKELHLAEKKRLLEKQSNLLSSLIFFFVLLVTITGIHLSLKSNVILWFIGQLVLAVSFMQWQVLLHDMGHGHFFRPRWVNDITGHFASIFPIVPYLSWKLIHTQHHRWTGYKCKDPTMSNQNVEEIPEQKIKLMNFFWKYWIPVFSLSYSFSNFWNIKKISKIHQASKVAITLNVVLLISFYIFLVIFFSKTFFQCWLFAYYIFLSLSEPLLFSQHVHIDQHDHLTDGPDLKPIPTYEQDQYSRTLAFPTFISLFVLFGFDLHNAHHCYPELPSYLLHELDYKPGKTTNGLKWYFAIKKMPSHTLLFMNSQKTGFDL